MYKTLKIILFFYLLPIAGQAQSLIELVQEISEQVIEVKTEKYTYTQDLVYNKEAPYQVDLKVVETSNKKGDSKTFLYQFNLGDIAANQVRWDSKNGMKVHLTTVRQQDLIKHFEDGEQKNYESSVFIYCKDVETVRKLEESLKKVIPLAKKLWEKEIQLPDNLADLLQWLQMQIGTVEIGEANIKQQLTMDANYPERVNLAVIDTDDKGKVNTYTQSWSFGDIHNPSLKMNVKGKQVYVEAKTLPKLKYVMQLAEDGKKSFVGGFKFYTENPDNAALLLLGLDKILSLSRRTLQQRMTSDGISLETALNELAQFIQPFEVVEQSYQQGLLAACQSTYSYELEEKKKNKAYELQFHFGDFNKTSIATSVSKSLLKIKVNTEQKTPLIQKIEEESTKYESTVTFLAPDVESARKIEQLLSIVTEQCPQENTPQSFDLLSQMVNDFADKEEKISQTLTAMEDKDCQVVFQKMEVGKKETFEETFEFNWRDVNEKTIALKVQKNQPVLSFKADKNQDIFNYHNSKGKMGFKNEVAWLIQDIPMGKVAVASVKALVKTCKLSKE